ncbi:hypothetical protein [Ohtaekwangia koreensis]|uniref:SpoIIAA-like n=1 Tax=Ohtaekwangia koreensis TaxID=688867 RepID=A0A1T5JU44_9BACT|nr:hypothetical protein [Ohtaekwangia koreensis]SKC54871.1 hypothetical protein SAMN05660236_1483 [Ohtaekwangia koreensis]
MRIFFEEDYITIQYNETNCTLVTTFIKPSLSKEFREGMLVLIGAMQHFKTGRVIFDTSGLGALFLEDQLWIAEYWYELAISAGYEKVAFIIPEGTFAQFSVTGATTMVKKRIPTGYFGTEQEAYDWINEGFIHGDEVLKSERTDK